MKQMTEQECRNFVLSGFIPTSNEDIADIQDCFNHQSVDFQIGLLIDPETHQNAERLMRACLHCEQDVNDMVKHASDIAQRLTLRRQYAEHITRLEAKIRDMREYIEQTGEDDLRFGDFLK